MIYPTTLIPGQLYTVISSELGTPNDNILIYPPETSARRGHPVFIPFDMPVMYIRPATAEEVDYDGHICKLYMLVLIGNDDYIIEPNRLIPFNPPTQKQTS